MRRNRLRRMKNRGHVVQEISMTPLVDVALTLLIIFMVATPMLQNVIKVELPSSRIDDGVPSSQTQQDLTVYIDKGRKMYLNGTEYPLQTLLKELKSLVKKGKDEIVFVKADQAVPYGIVIDLVDTIKVSGGIKYVALATKRSF
ncbi:MAG: biopolymer transporter ExbD [Candidatus Dependentiae bacterium]|nr:biopolymer transporter ExbD [Candidatus Dependentiae bacterium]